jgi:hypothetical protein
MTINEIRQKINEEDDFVNLKRLDFSLEKALIKYQEGCPDKVIAQALAMTEEDVEEFYQKTITKLQYIMGIG